MSTLTLPGIPGQLRLGSVVRSVRSERDVPPGSRGVVVQVLASGAFIVAFRWSDDPAAVDCEAFEEVNAGDAALDLTDATGRAHAAWWLGGEAAAVWSCKGWWRVTWASPSGSGERRSRAFPLADLDPNDPRLLPDGSRWVDAEALRRVCLHVAGTLSDPCPIPGRDGIHEACTRGGGHVCRACGATGGAP